MLSNVDQSIFLNSSAIQLLPTVSAEWNQNLFNPPFLTVAGTGVAETVSLTSGYSVINVTDSNTKGGDFTTKKFNLSNGSGDISYDISTANNGSAYKIVTYVKTDNALPVMINSYAKGTKNQFGSSQVEANSFGWTKIETYIGSPESVISSFNYVMSINSYSTSSVESATFFYTEPKVYETTFFDYQYNSLWPTDSVFTYFRPGESYVSTGDKNFSLPTDYRKINTEVIHGYSTSTCSPISPILNNPSFSFAKIPVPVLKSVLASDMDPYKYFVSDVDSKSISALYEQNISANKIVIKFNSLMTMPTVNVAIDGVSISIASSTNLMPDSNGILILYWTGTEWTKDKWNTMPHITTNGSVSNFTSFKKITVTQVNYSINTEFTSFTSISVIEDLKRMQIIEISPRLEVDLSDYVKDVTVNKSLDSKNNFVPISSINTDDATIILSAIPAISNYSLVPLFSSQSNLSSNILTNMLRKNIKFYVNFNILSYFNASTNSFVQLPTSGPNAHNGVRVPAGIFYSDVWDETDIKDVRIQCYDITRYLQTTPVPDYVANLKSVFDIITNILDLAGFTDYDYDSLHTVCNDNTMPLDLAYFYCNSKDMTVMDAISQIFLAYQIGAYMDEYGIMKFKSLSTILASKTSSITINEAHVVEGGYSISNKAKPGKISIRYQSPKIKQSLALQNATDTAIAASPSFIFTTSNDVLWSQQSMDSVGFNYLDEDMLEKSNRFKLNINDTLDIFHTYSLNNNGFAAIEDEIVSLVYKEYTLQNEFSPIVTVSVKNDIELQSEINRFNKKYQTGLKLSNGEDKNTYNTLVTPTGYITEVQRGLFGTVASEHTKITTLGSKNLSESVIDSSFNINNNTSKTTIISSDSQSGNNPIIQKIQMNADPLSKTIVYPTEETDNGYATYSVKFDLIDQEVAAAGLFFNLNNSLSDSTDAYFVELIKFNQINSATTLLYSPPRYRYCLAIYQNDGLNNTIVAWADVSGIVLSIIKSFEKVIVKEIETPTKYSYTTTTDEAFLLKVVHYPSDTENGEDAGEICSIFLNNVEINGFQIRSSNGEISGLPWNAPEINSVTKRSKKIILPSQPSSGTVFGFYCSTTPVLIEGVTDKVGFPTIDSTKSVANLRQIYGTQKALKERSVNYWFQDRNFLNGMVQGTNTFSDSLSYNMQTTPEVLGINYYDVQYTNPAAVSADVEPVSYLLYYYPGVNSIDKQNYQSLSVDEYAVAYSTVINTGFRAKIAIANNSPHMVFLSHQSDSLINMANNFTIFTHEIIAPSDPEILEKILDPSNISEVAQVDSPWIQSKEAANKMLNVLAHGFDGFSKDTRIKVFGNPLIQVGDVITISYPLAGINQQKYLIHSVSQSFNQGLTTELVLNTIDRGIAY